MPVATRRERSERGFTLVELVIAIAILSIGGIAGFRAINVSVSQTSQARELLYGQTIAMNRAAELRFYGARAVDSLPRIVRMAGADWSVATVVAATAAGFVEADITVRPDDSDAEDGISARLVAYVRR